MFKESLPVLKRRHACCFLRLLHWFVKGCGLLRDASVHSVQRPCHTDGGKENSR